jgi:hypothetical protein
MIEGFLLRNPRVAARKVKNLNPERTRKLNRFLLTSIVRKLEQWFPTAPRGFEKKNDNIK